MPWCPNCKVEYRDGFETCSDCGGELDPGSLPQEQPWIVLSPKRTIFEVGLTALGASIAAFLAFMVATGLSVATADVDGTAPLSWRVIYSTAQLVAICGTPPLIGYVHARLLKRRMSIKPVLLAWVLGFLPMAVASRGVGLLLAVLGAAGTMLGCRVGLALHGPPPRSHS